MATGDIVSVTIRADGWSADVVQEGDCTGGVYDFGLGTNNADVGSAKFVLTVTSEGYNASGVLGTIARTVYGTAIVRKPYPDQATLDATYSDPNTTTRIALSDFVYDDDKNGGAGTSGVDVAVAISGGWCTVGGNPQSAYSGTATNNSTLDYPKVVGNWAWPGYSHVGAAFDLEFEAFHRFGMNGKPVACVRFDVDDAHSNNVNSTVTSMVVCDHGEPNKVSAYKYTVSTSSFTQADLLTCRARAYPWVGDANSILDTGDAVNTMPTPKYAPHYRVCDKNTSYGAFCVVDGSSDGTSAAVYATQAAAEAAHTGSVNTAYQTIAAALGALQTYHNTHYSHNDAGGGTILLAEGTHTLNSTAGGTMAAFPTVMPITGAAKVNTIVQAAAANAGIPNRLKLSGVTFSGTNYFRGYDVPVLWLHDCACNTTGTLTIWQMPVGYATLCTGTLAKGFQTYSTSRTDWGIVRGCTMPNNWTYGYMALGNSGVACMMPEGGGTGNDNGVFAFNSRMGVSGVGFGEMWKTTALTHGFAIVCNLIESNASSSYAILQLSADNQNVDTNNVILWHNTFVGERCNLAYNETGTSAHNHLNWSQKFNVFDLWNNKDDTFGTQNAARVGSWPVGYNVGTYGCVHEADSGTGSFRGEYDGINVVWGSAAIFIDDNSGSGGGGSGDYHPNTNSPALSRIASGMSVIPFDIAGIAIPNDGTGDAGAYQDDLTSAPTVTTTAASNVTATSAVLGCNVTSDGGDLANLRCGVCWGTSENPVYTGNNLDFADSTTGAQSGTATDLTPGTLYYSRGWGDNSEGLVYGDNETFTTLKYGSHGKPLTGTTGAHGFHGHRLESRRHRRRR